MAGRRQVFLVTDEAATTSAVTAALESETPIGNDDVC
jgi:hypothetical protein